MKAISTLFLPVLETEVRHANLCFSRCSIDPLKTSVTWTSLSSSDHEADFNNLFRSFKSTFVGDFLGNTVYPGDISQFTILTHSVISSGAEKNLQMIIRNPYAREEMWFEFPQKVEGMGCASPSSSMGALIAVNYLCVYTIYCVLLIHTRSNPFWGE